MIPHERSLVEKFAGRPFAIVGVNSDVDRQRTLARQEAAGVSWRSFWDGGGKRGPIATAWNVRGWPTFFLIDQEGILRMGAPRWQLEEKIEALVAAAEQDPAAAGLLPPPLEGGGGPDWLVDPAPYRARVVWSGGRRAVRLENGLVRRSFLLAPDAATVGLDELGTGAALLRAVRPEARLVLDGVELAVGGLEGQPDHAFLLPEWLDGLRPLAGAFHLATAREEPVQVPFRWHRARHAEDRPWPPPGRHLALEFRLDPDTARRCLEAAARDEERLPLLTSDAFWEGEGPANHADFRELEWPGGGQVVRCRVEPGSDASASWGPGLALAWPDFTLKVNLRPGEGRYGVWDGRRERLLGHHAGGPVTLTIRLAGDRARFLAGGETLAEVALPPGAGPPRLLRVGKTDPRGGASDHGTPGPTGRCAIRELEVLGPLGPEAAERLDVRAAVLAEVVVTVHHEIYDGLPVLAKWLEVRNGGRLPVRLERFTSEVLACVEAESQVEAVARPELPPMTVVSDYAFHGMDAKSADVTTRWVADPEYRTQVNYRRQAPVLLEVRPPLGPDRFLEPGARFATFRNYLVVHDTTDRERRGLAVRRFFRTLAPWTTENPLMMHLRTAEPEAVRRAVDQCVEAGFELLILSFGSGFDIENDDPEYLATMRELADYAHARGIQIGGYGLLSSRSIGPETDVVNPETGRPGGAIFGSAPCLGSAWGRRYFAKLRRFFEVTGFDCLEHDGSYPGDVCASTRHPGHRGLADSQWRQWERIRDFYRWCRERGIYLNVPDFYVLNGSNKVGMGYRETNWSLPRELQVLHARQNIFDGTWLKPPTMGWMFVPLTEYHGGGAAATLEPLRDHLDAYEAQLAANLGYGVQACWRGPRLYDAPATLALLRRWTAFFRRHRAILESDLIHLRRADGRDLDFMLHVNPRLEERALLMVHNPLPEEVERVLRVPLHYAGLAGAVLVSAEGGPPERHALDGCGSLRLGVRVPARSQRWYLFRAVQGDD